MSHSLVYSDGETTLKLKINNDKYWLSFAHHKTRIIFMGNVVKPKIRKNGGRERAESNTKLISARSFFACSGTCPQISINKSKATVSYAASQNASTFLALNFRLNLVNGVN